MIGIPRPEWQKATLRDESPPRRLAVQRSALYDIAGLI